MGFATRIGIPPDRDILAGFNRAMAKETENDPFSETRT
jgi:hypothetical protein